MISCRRSGSTTSHEMRPRSCTLDTRLPRTPQVHRRDSSLPSLQLSSKSAALFQVCTRRRGRAAQLPPRVSSRATKRSAEGGGVSGRHALALLPSPCLYSQGEHQLALSVATLVCIVALELPPSVCPVSSTTGRGPLDGAVTPDGDVAAGMPGSGQTDTCGCNGHARLFPRGEPTRVTAVTAAAAAAAAT